MIHTRFQSTPDIYYQGGRGRGGGRGDRGDRRGGRGGDFERARPQTAGGDQAQNNGQ